MDIQTLASIATMLATGIAIMTYVGRQTGQARAEAKADNAATREVLGSQIDKTREELGRRIDEAKADNVATREELGRRIDEAKADNVATRVELGRRIDEARAEAKADNAVTREEIVAMRAELKAELAVTRDGLGRRIDDVGEHLGGRIDRVESDVAEVRADVRMLADRLFNVVLAPTTRVLPSAQGD